MSLISSNGLQNQCEILKRNLQKINFQQQITFQAFQEKNPIVFLQILHYAVISYNVDFYKKLIDKGYELFSKSDQNFIQSVYKFLQKEYDYKPQITIDQFFTNVYLEKKLILCNDIIEIIIKTTNEKVKKAQQGQKQAKQDKTKPQKNSNAVQEDEQLPVVKVVKENIPIQSNLQKQKDIPNYQQQEDDYDEQPRKFNLAAIKSQSQDLGQDTSQRKQITPIQENQQNQPQNFQEQYQIRQQQKYNSQNIQSKLDNVKQDVQEVQYQQNLFDSSKQEIVNQCNQLTEKVQKMNIQNQKQQIYEDDQDINDNNNIQKQIRNNDLKAQNKMNSQDRPVSARDLNEVMKIIMSLSQAQQELIHKFDQHQTQTKQQILNINAQLMLLDGEVKLMKAIQQNK